MLRAISLLLLLFGFVISGTSQTLIKLTLLDRIDDPVPFAAVLYKSNVLKSDEFGITILKNYVFGEKILIQRTGFYDTTVILQKPKTIPDTIGFTIRLHSKVTLLGEVPVYSNYREEINPKRSDFILDYELYSNKLIELLSNDNLNFLNNQNKNLFSLKAYPNSEKIIKDPLGDVNLITSERVYKLIPEDNCLRIDTTAMSLDKFNWGINYCEGVYDTMFYVKRFGDLNQTVSFFAISHKSNKLLKKITDEDRKLAVIKHAAYVNALAFSFINDTNLAGIMGDISIQELEARRESESKTWMLMANYVLPSYNILRIINDSVYIFAHDVDSIFVFNKNGKQFRKMPVKYQHLKIWNKEIIINEEKTRAFAVFKNFNSLMLGEINLASGEVKLPFFKLESTYLPKKIRIRANKVYYMCKQRDGIGYTVFCQNLHY